MSIYIKCFKLFLLISFIWIIAIFTIKLSATQIESSFNTIVDDEVNYSFDEKIENVIVKDSYQIYISKNNSYLYSDKLIETFNEIVIDFEYNECIYLISKNKIFKYNFKTIKELEIADVVLYDIYIYENYIYVTGQKNNDALCIKLNINLEIIEQILLGGDGEEKFINVFIKDNIYYLIGKKDSISLNSPFKNVGKINTEKIFIIMYYDSIIDEIYFNTSDSDESLINVIYDNYIYLLLNTYEIFKLDYDFNIYPSKKITYSFDNIFVDINKELGVYQINNNTLYINNLFVYKATNEIMSFIPTNEIALYIKNNSKLSKINLFIYQIIKNDELILDKYNFDYNTLDNLIIYSPFEKIEKTLLDSSVLNKQIHGTYDVTYLIKRTNNKSFNIYGSLTVKPYSNVIDNGVYKIGKTLSFFGKAYLNGQEVFNGYVITKPGKYVLKLLNNIYEETIYNFQIVENYYKECEVINYKTDYEIKQDEKVIVNILIKNFSYDDIEKIIINDETYDNYTVEENQIKINLPSSNNYNISNYYLDKIVLRNNVEIKINKSISIKTLKKNPNITLDQSVNDNNLILEYNISDLDKTVMYLKTNIYQNDNLLHSINNYLINDQMESLNNLSKENITIEHILIYHNGQNEKQISLAKYNISSVKGSDLFEINYKIDSSLKTLEIKINHKKVKLSNLIINQSNILNDINFPDLLDNNNALYFIILGSFVVFSISLILLKIKHKQKKKQTN